MIARRAVVGYARSQAQLYGEVGDQARFIGDSSETLAQAHQTRPSHLLTKRVRQGQSAATITTLFSFALLYVAEERV